MYIHVHNGTFSSSLHGFLIVSFKVVIVLHKARKYEKGNSFGNRVGLASGYEYISFEDLGALLLLEVFCFLSWMEFRHHRFKR